MPTLIPTTLEYLDRYGIEPPSSELWEFLMRKNGAGEYAACHFWTNFEASPLPVDICRLDIVRCSRSCVDC